MLYFANDLEAVVLVKGNVLGIRAFQIGGNALLIASLKSVFHQQCTKSLPDPVRIGRDERQVPMRLGRMMFSHFLPQERHISGDLWVQGLRH
ncbi:hypothetical protein XI09_13770 [Bradyrhizobium sp. CCBAU 11386]|nr:hypothetical protein [Bradyrhizobium sp. CCBAU 11361]MDA9505698.1 hypothetical protein [Bradyrhizobium sp. CCBAU 11386]